MSRRRPPARAGPVTPDLFGDQVRPIDDGEVDLALQLVDATDKAFLLAAGRGKARKVAWIPKARARRGEGANVNVFTMRRSDARARGWL